MTDGATAGKNPSIPFAGMMGHGAEDTGAPKAYLNILVFNEEDELVNFAYKQLSTSASEEGSDVPHENIDVYTPIYEPGYVYIYLSNESGSRVEVFPDSYAGQAFDDFRVNHAHGLIVQKDDFYPFGLSFNSYMRPGETDQNFKFNGKERDEVMGWDDFGARMYMPDLGRWGVTDGKAELYFANSPYNYALNTPVNAIDPDGDVVIFVNGLGGGGESYWRQYQNLLVTDRRSTQWMDPGKYHYDRREVNAFDRKVMQHLNDYNVRYIDGSPSNITSNVSPFFRWSRGYQDGRNVASQLIENLARDPQGNITESIKIITHSMGGVYGKGFVSALKKHIRRSKDPQIRKVLISLVADFDPFQAGSSFGDADPDIYTQQFINAGMMDLDDAGWLANQEENGAEKVIRNENLSSHFIEAFFSNISNLQEGSYVWDKNDQRWVCTSCN